jgi:hypothetical protein
MIYGTVSARISLSDGAGISFSLTSLNEADLERQFKTEVERFFAERRQKKFKKPAKAVQSNGKAKALRQVPRRIPGPRGQDGRK